MKRQTWAGVLLAAGLLLGLSSSPAAANPTINAKFTGLGLSQSGATVTYLGNSYASNAGGRFDWTVLSNPSNLQFRSASGISTSSFISFCIELTQNVSPGSTYNNISVNALKDSPQPGTAGTPMGATAAALLANMWYQAITTAANPLPLTNAVNAAAFQIAIWEIVYDAGNGLNLGTGSVKASGNSAIINAANAYLLSANANGPKASLYGISQGPTANFQDQVVEIVPEPASIVAWSLIGGCFVVGGRLRRKSS